MFSVSLYLAHHRTIFECIRVYRNKSEAGMIGNKLKIFHRALHRHFAYFLCGIVNLRISAF